jgi:hypothetical protein
MAAFVLVHGAWHGGWCWKKLTPLLRAAGHEVFTPTLTGLGERVHLLGPQVASPPTSWMWPTCWSTRTCPAWCWSGTATPAG